METGLYKYMYLINGLANVPVYKYMSFNLRLTVYYVYYASFVRPSPLPSFDSARKLDVREIAIFGGARKLNARKLDSRKLDARKLSEVRYICK